MRGAESVVYKNIGQRSKLPAQLGIVFGFALFKTGIFQQHDIAVLERGGFCLCVFSGNVSSHNDFLTQKLAQTVSDDFQGQLRLPFALGLAHMGAKNDAGAVLNEVFNGRQSRNDTLVAGDFSFLGGNVEIAAAKHALTLYVNGFHGFFVVIHKWTSCKECCFIFP